LKPTVISLFTGIGGLDFGFESAGFRTAVALELDRTACRTVRLNRKKWPLIEDDVHHVTPRQLLRKAGLRKGQADVLIGGPPCQPFSKSGYWASGDSDRLADPRANTLSAYLKVLEETKPRAFLLENVRGLAYQGKDEGLSFLLEGIEAINARAKTNYTVSWATLNAADYGVPQLRERVFLIGSRDGRTFRFPEPTHGEPSTLDLFSRREAYRTAWDAIGDLPEPKLDDSLVVGGRWGDLLPSIPEGQNYLWHTGRGGGYPLFGWRRRYWNFLLKLAKRLPAWTIQAQPGTATGPFHWNNRRLTAQELCRLQTFPDGLDFDCGRNEAQRMLGNAVPSLLAEVLALEVRRQLLGSERLRRLPKLTPPDRGAPPRAESTRGLPKKYHGLIGEHAEHPGAGRGPGRRSEEAEELPLEF